MNLFSIFKKTPKESIEIEPIKVMDNGVVRFPETQKISFLSNNFSGDYDRTLDGQIKKYLGSLGYWDNEHEADPGVPRLKVICEYCGGKTDFHYYTIFCWFSKIIQQRYYYNCRKCGKKTFVDQREENKFERGIFH